jgi:hypothetical protein
VGAGAPAAACRGAARPACTGARAAAGRGQTARRPRRRGSPRATAVLLVGA